MMLGTSSWTTKVVASSQPLWLDVRGSASADSIEEEDGHRH